MTKPTTCKGVTIAAMRDHSHNLIHQKGKQQICEDFCRRMIDTISNTTGNVPSRLMAILEGDDVNKSMHWELDGRAFTIADPKLFADTALKKYFKGVQFGSFIKNLRQWGFKMTGSKCAGRYTSYTFSCDLFVRDQPELCNSMQRLTKKKWKAQIVSKRKVASATQLPCKPKPNRSCSVMPVLVPCLSMQIGWPMQTYLLSKQYSCGVKSFVQKRKCIEKPNKNRQEDTVTILRQKNKVSITKDELSAVIGITMLDSTESAFHQPSVKG